MITKIIQIGDIHIRNLRRSDEYKAQFDEFLNLASCLMPETPLGQIVAIRSEKDGEVIRNFNDAQRKIYNDWANREVDKSEQEYRDSMDKLFAMLRA